MRKLTLIKVLEYYDEDVESDSDTYQLEVPVRDRNTFSTLVSRMGWRVSSLMSNPGKVAVL